MMVSIAHSPKEAKQQGLTRYFTGKPCPKGHVAERMAVNSDCVGCMNDRNSLRYSFKEDYRARTKSRMNKSYDADPEKFRQRANDRYLMEPEVIRSRVKRYQERNPEKCRAWRRAKHARKQQAPGAFSREDVERIFKEQSGRCLCGYDLNLSYHIDHKTPFLRGGSNWPENIQLLCPKCNMNKHTKTMEEWLPSAWWKQS